MSQKFDKPRDNTSLNDTLNVLVRSIGQIRLGMHQAQEQIGNPGLGPSRTRSFPVQGIPGLIIHIISVGIITDDE